MCFNVVVCSLWQYFKNKTVQLQWNIIDVCMFSLYKHIGVGCHVGNVVSVDDMSYRENIFSFAAWFKTIAIRKTNHNHYYMRLCKHFGISLQKFGCVFVTSDNLWYQW